MRHIGKSILCVICASIRVHSSQTCFVVGPEFSDTACFLCCFFLPEQLVLAYVVGDFFARSMFVVTCLWCISVFRGGFIFCR